jgi:RND family efflux transporter MFP subunit
MNDVESYLRPEAPLAPEIDFPRETPEPDHETARRHRRAGWFLGTAIAVVLIGGLSYGALNYLAQRREAVATTKEELTRVPRVRTAAVKANSEVVAVSLPATTSAYATANIFARASGYIGRRNVDIGDRVKQGQLLIQIVAPELDHQIAQAQATLAQLNAAVAQAQANYDLAVVTWDRDRPLVAQGWVTQQQGSVDQQTLKARESAVGVAKANVEAQRAQLQVLSQQKAYQDVVAPFDGVITQRNVDVGSLVQADATSGTFLFTLMQSNVVRTQVFVPQDQAFGLGPGVDAVLHVPEIPDRTFPGKVTRISDALQPGTRTLLTEVDIPNPDGVLVPGIYCTVELQIPRRVPSLIVPADAVIFNRNGVQVAAIEDGTVRLRKITIARDLGTQVEVRTGVKEGDQVVLNPSVQIADGSKVETTPVALNTPATGKSTD